MDTPFAPFWQGRIPLARPLRAFPSDRAGLGITFCWFPGGDHVGCNRPMTMTCFNAARGDEA